METGFLCEQKLKKENPALHLLFTNSVVCMQQMLNKYQVIFPTYTDHTALHSLEVIDFCNILIGKWIYQLNADEIYVLLMSAYLHDSGMGITQKDFQEFSRNISFGDYFELHPDAQVPDIIRDFHQEFSEAYIKKYAEVFEIPSAEHIFAIVQTSRGIGKRICQIPCNTLRIIARRTGTAFACLISRYCFGWRMSWTSRRNAIFSLCTMNP
ncbi:MAG: hypothetical protein LIP11_00095 [Clostridiales bacterium]|nr:hypothetical protein [Clostridiales bacterium]